MSAATTDAGAPLRRDAEVIGLVALAHGTSHFFHLMLPSLFPWLMAAFGLNFTQVGFLTTVFFIVSATGQALAGFVVDRIGARPVLYFGIAMLGLSGLVLSAAGSYGALLATAVLAGVGNSIFHPADFTLLNRQVSSARLGHAFSMHGLAGNLGWTVSPIVMAGIAGLTDWRSAGLVAAAVAFLVLALLFVRRSVLSGRASEVPIRGQEPEGAPDPSAPGGAQALSFLRSGVVWVCFVFFFLTTGAAGILQNFSASVLSHVYQLPLKIATGGLVAYLVGGSIGIVAGGFVAARVRDSDRTIGVALGAAAAVAVLLAAGAVPGWLVLPLMAVLGFGVGVAGPNRDLLVRKAATSRFGKAAFGRVYGFVYSGLDLGLATAPLLIAPLLDAGHFSAALISVAVLQIAALLSALRVGRSVRSETFAA